jgi:hypothetical protein
VSLIGLGRPMCVDFAGPGRLLREGGALDRPERRVHIGRGWFGPQSPIKLIKALNGFGSMYWYYQQLRHVARTGELDPSLGVLTALRRERRDQAAWLAAAAAAADEVSDDRADRTARRRRREGRARARRPPSTR